MPFGGYRDFDDCKAQNSDKDIDDLDAYCAAFMQAVEGTDTGWVVHRKPPTDRIYSAIVSTENLDKQGSVIDKMALLGSLANHMKVGILEWMHEKDPIGIPISWRIKDGNIALRWAVYNKDYGHGGTKPGSLLLAMYDSAWARIKQHGTEGRVSIRGFGLEERECTDSGLCFPVVKEMDWVATGFVERSPANPGAKVLEVNMLAKQDAPSLDPDLEKLFATSREAPKIEKLIGHCNWCTKRYEIMRTQLGMTHEMAITLIQGEVDKAWSESRFLALARYKSQDRPLPNPEAEGMEPQQPPSKSDEPAKVDSVNLDVLHSMLQEMKTSQEFFSKSIIEIASALKALAPPTEKKEVAPPKPDPQTDMLAKIAKLEGELETLRKTQAEILTKPISKAAVADPKAASSSAGKVPQSQDFAFIRRGVFR